MKILCIKVKMSLVKLFVQFMVVFIKHQVFIQEQNDLLDVQNVQKVTKK